MSLFTDVVFKSFGEKESRTAIVDKNGQRRTTWGALRGLCLHIATYAQKCKLSGVVPVAMERGVEAVAVIMGLNMAGLGVAPLSGNIPKERLEYIERETNSKAFGMEEYNKAMQTDIDYTTPIKVQDPAMVIFTSGSTGKPKGVMLSNKVVGKACVRNSERFMQHQKGDIGLQVASFSFVATLPDLFSALYAGIEVHILPEEARKDANLMTKYINEHKITVAYLTPKMVHLLGKMPSMRRVFVGGERFVGFSTNDYELVNNYGMSEMVAGALSFAVSKPYDNTPIGKPDVDFEVYLVDEQGKLADEGELCMSGDIAMGYYHDEALTAKVFTANPFSNKKGHEVLLHSGDIARRLPDGNYLFISRKDHMIKINGQRVEPGEAEAIIKSELNVKDAVVVGYSESDGNSYLCAYYVSEKELDIDEAKRVLGKKLLAYSIPTYWVKLDKMPVNENGKTDRKALKKPQTNALVAEYVAPTNDSEAMVCRAFEKVLKAERVGICDDFIILGGDSIKAMEVTSLVTKFTISANDIMMYRTPKKIVAATKNNDIAIYEPQNKVEKAPLLNSQMGIYQQCMMCPCSVMYNIPLRVRFNRNNIDASAVKKAVDGVLALHSALYSSIEIGEDGVYMCRHSFPSGGICTVEEVQNFTEPTNFVRHFDLQTAPLCRAAAYLDNEYIYIYLDCHHIVSDGTSMTLIVRQISDALQGKQLTLESLDAFAVYDEERHATDAKIDESKAYFSTLLAGNEVDSNLIFDNKPDENTNHISAKEEIVIKLPDLPEFLKSKGLTENSFFMGVFGYTLAKMTGQNSSVFAVAENGRKSIRLASTVSMFVRILPVLYSLDEDQNALDFLLGGQEQFFKSIANNHCTFGEIASETGATGDVMFVYQSDLLSDFEGAFGRVEVKKLPVNECFANLAISVWKHSDGFVVNAEYRSECYKTSTIRRFLSLFNNVAQHFANNAILKTIPLISECDKLALSAQNENDFELSDNETILDLFKKSVELYPDKDAVVCKDMRLTYKQVDEMTNGIAAYIHDSGIKKGQTVSVLIPRCEYMLVASIGVLKAGAVYQPLDPSYPQKRLSFMCEDADSRLLIADRELLPLVPDYKSKVLCLDEISSLPKDEYFGNPKPDDGFVLLYTSGTTGLPKGCLLLHRNITSFVRAMLKITDMNSNMVSGVYASYGFDAHLSELYPAIAVGGTLHIITDDIRLDLSAVKEYFEKNGITHTVMTTQIAKQFVAEYPEVKHLRYILAGGEKLTKITPPSTYTLINGYGPTETTVMITCFFVDGVYEDIPIGKPLPNVKVYVVDGYGRQVPIGVPGELLAFGPQVAGGYINRPEKTAEVFIKNTLEKVGTSHENGYKTGDIVRFLENGNLEILGRRDTQIKIRGFRIELSEVESVIREFPAISDATVVAAEDAQGGKCIHAYIVSDKQIDIEQLYKFIADKKPAYMVPSATKQIEKIPLTPNLKVDKRKLPPIITEETNDGTNTNRELTELEKQLTAMTAEIIGHSNTDINKEFAYLGINSITSIKLSVQIFKNFGLHISSKELLDGGTILSVENAIVEYLLKNRGVAKADKVQATQYPLTQTQLGIYSDSLVRGEDTYLISFLLELDGHTAINKLKKSIVSAVKMHPSMLCYIYPNETGEVFTYPVPSMEINVDEIFSTLPVEPTHFKFEKSPLFRFRIIKDNDKIYLLTELHHIIADGESVKILLRDIEVIYNGGKVNKEEYLSFDLAKDEQEARDGKSYEIAKNYYDSVFRGISADYLPKADKFERARFSAYDACITTGRRAIQSFCKENCVSENVFFCGAFAVTLALFTSHTGALFATIHNGRTDPRTENLVAMTVKTLPVYLDTPQEAAITEFLSGVSDKLRLLKNHDYYSFADCAHDYGVVAEPMFIYQGDLIGSMPLGKVVPMKSTQEHAKTAISLEVSGSGDGFNIHCEFNGGMYSEAWVAGFVDSYNTCIDQMLKCKALGEIDICSRKALEEFSTFNDTAWDVKYRPAYRLIEESTGRHPDKKAVVDATSYITYRQLDNMSNALARKICDLNMLSHSTAIVLLDRTKEIYVAQVGILKSANAFLCISIKYPDDRIRFIVKNSNSKVIITTRQVAKDHQELLNELNIPLIFVDDIDCNVEATSLNLDVEPDALAYLIYTSGSTGTPKGVTVTNLGLVNACDPNPKNPEVTKFVGDNSVSTAVSAFSFDASVYEGFVALASGSTVCIVDESGIHNPEALCAFCLENKVTSMLGTPAFLTALSDYSGFGAVVKSLTTVLAGGEEFPASLLNKLLELNPNLCVLNGYGPSEATITCSCKELKRGERITIGTPLSNTMLYCLDKQNHILPMGAMGELTIVGDRVGKGYLYRDDLTQKAFITINGKPAFKTGDLAIITHGGEIEFHGRIDNQVKIRGLRVELGEIESAINVVRGIKTSVVVVKGENENKYLACYYTAERTIPANEIIEIISKKLAQYMVPRVFCQLETMPITANGKIDKKALPEIQLERQNRPGATPSTDTEKCICFLFKEVLGVEQVFADDNFFEIGGNSISASRVVMQLKAKGYTIEFQTFFDHQTPRSLAQYLDRGSQSIEDKQESYADGKDPTDSKLKSVLQYNTMQYVEEIERKPLENVLLVGAVGFLGIHVLNELLTNEKCHIYCLLRKGTYADSSARLADTTRYYFGESFLERFADRLTIVDADIISDNLCERLKNYSLGTIINCAASVKHYSSDNSIEITNVTSVENLIALAKEKDACLIHVSTTSIAGAHTEDSLKNNVMLHENQIFICDNMNNQYIISKYHAELRVINAIKDGMKGKIIRVGNLMGRFSDGMFQKNMGTNAFLSALKGFSVIGKMPISHCTDPMEFSAIDCTAKVIVLLAGTSDRYTLFHANNRYSFDEMMLINVCNKCGVKIVPTEEKTYYKEYNKLLGDPLVNKYLSGLVTNDRPDITPVAVDNRFTTSALYHLGFSWPFMSEEYLEKVITYLVENDFFKR